MGAADASGQRLPGATSRWNRGKDLSWEPLRAERVVEVAYDHLQGDRFRHATTFKRWRPDKRPGRLPLRPARGDAAVRDRADLRRRRAPDDAQTGTRRRRSAQTPTVAVRLPTVAGFRRAGRHRAYWRRPRVGALRGPFDVCRRSPARTGPRGSGAAALRSRLLARRRAPSWPPVGFVAPVPRVVVGVERSPGAGRCVLRHVDQVHPDAVPDRRPAAHPVDQDVGRLEVRGDLGMARLPALEARRATSAFVAARAISMTGMFDLRRPVGVGRVPTHSVGSPAFGSPAATAAARSAATSGGGPPSSPRPARTRRRPCRLRDGWTRGGSPSCFA